MSRVCFLTEEEILRTGVSEKQFHAWLKFQIALQAISSPLSFHPLQKSMGLTASQFLILLAVAAHSPEKATVQNISQILDKSPQSVRALCRKLSDSGFLIVASSPLRHFLLSAKSSRFLEQLWNTPDYWQAIETPLSALQKQWHPLQKLLSNRKNLSAD